VLYPQNGDSVVATDCDVTLPCVLVFYRQRTVFELGTWHRRTDGRTDRQQLCLMQHTIAGDSASSPLQRVLSVS